MTKPKVHSTLTQLRSAFKKHIAVFKNDRSHGSHQLLLFYAVECGLKAKFLERRREVSTECLINYFPGRDFGPSHNIPMWVRELKISAPDVDKFIENPKDQIENVHEKLRYGVSLASRDQIQYLDSLANILIQNQL